MKSGEDDKIYVSNPIKVEQFKQSWLQAFADSSSWSPIMETQQQLTTMNLTLPSISDELESELNDVCSEKALTCPDEAINYAYASRKSAKSLDPVFHNVPKNINLTTLKLQREEIAKRWHDMNYMKSVMNRRKRRYESEIPLHYSYKKSDEVVEAVDQADVILTVTVFETSRGYVKKSLHFGGFKYQVLGSQKLTVLRDEISCTSDLMVPGDYSHNPDVPQETRAKDLYKSGFFFINNIFYNDMRDPTCRDYSKVIMDWASANPSRELGPFRKAKMEETYFSDLEIQLGYPYLYTHQGNCEHLVVFNDLMMVNPDGCMDRTRYPLHINIRRKRGKKCMICHVLTPRWITRNNDRLPLDPYFFCDTCFRSFNYDKKGEKIGEFIAHPYIDSTVLR